MDDVSGGHKILEQGDRGLGNSRRIIEFDNEGQIHHQAQEIGGMDSPLATETRNAAKHDDAMYLVLVLKDVENLLHQRLLAAVIRFFQINPYHGDIVVHETLLQVSCDVGTAERGRKPKDNRQDQVKNRLELRALFYEQQKLHLKG
jgi:hypothetical protein